MASKFAFAAWVLILVLVFVIPNPPNDPPSAPAGCGLVNGAPYYVCEPVTYEERFSPEAIGPSPADYDAPPYPDTDHFDGCQCEDCFPYYASPICEVSRAAVTAQGGGRMNASAPLIETYLWLVVLTLWTITGTLDLVARARRGREVAHEGT